MIFLFVSGSDTAQHSKDYNWVTDSCPSFHCCFWQLTSLELKSKCPAPSYSPPPNTRTLLSMGSKQGLCLSCSRLSLQHLKLHQALTRCKYTCLMNEWTNPALPILETSAGSPWRYSNNAPLKKKKSPNSWRIKENVHWNNEVQFFTARISKDLRDWQYLVLTWKSRKGHSYALLLGL